MFLKDLLARQRDNDKVAVIYGHEEISYITLYNKVVLASHLFNVKQIECNNVGIFIQKSINYVIAYFAISFVGKTIVPINNAVKPSELVNTIEYCELKYIITDSKSVDLLRKHLKNYTFEIKLFNIETMSFEAVGGCDSLPLGSTGNALQDIAILMHTSGSISIPKRVMLTHENLISCTESVIESLALQQDDRTLIALPLFLASANTSQLLTHIYLGATIVIMDTLFTPGYFFKLVEKYNVTNFTGVPFMVLSLIENKNQKGYNISSLRFICFGGAPTPVNKIRELANSFPSINFIHMYGQTEASTRISHLLPEESERRAGSVGKPIPGVEWRIVDHEGCDVQPEIIGEIIVKGKNVMRGYYKREEESSRAIKSGWLYTGDLGKLDNDGFAYIVGRRKSVVIKGGMNIYPEEIEEFLMQHPAVKEVCVMGEKHELFGEVPIAKVVLQKGCENISEKDLINYCCEGLSFYKVPDKIQLLDFVPRTDSGKIKRTQA